MRGICMAVLAAGLSLAGPAWAQKTNIIESRKGGGIVVTAAGPAVVFNHYKGSELNFSLTFPPGETQATDRAGMYTVNGMPLQVLAVPVAPFRTDSAETTLQRYIANEATYFQDQLKMEVKPFARVGTDKNGRLCAVWGFPMPEGQNAQVAQQVSVVFISGEYLISLASVQLQKQSMDEPLALLLSTAQSFQTSDQPIRLVPKARAGR